MQITIKAHGFFFRIVFVYMLMCFLLYQIDFLIYNNNNNNFGGFGWGGGGGTEWEASNICKI